MATPRSWAVAVVLATALTGCSGPAADPRPASASGGGAQGAAQLRALMAAPQASFSATLTARVTDDSYDARTNGAVNVADVQTGSLSTTALDGDTVATAYLTLTREASYRRTEEGPWTRTERAAEPLVPDHRPLVQALLAADPASYRGTVQLRTGAGGQGHHLSGRLPVDRLREAVGPRMFQRLTGHGVADCATDLLVDTAGRLAELGVDCAGGGYRLRSTLDLAEFGPVAEPEAPTGR